MSFYVALAVLVGLAVFPRTVAPVCRADTIVRRRVWGI